MLHIVTLVANRSATSLLPATIASVRDVVSGGTPTVLSRSEAADIPATMAPDMAAVHTALEGTFVDAICTPTEGRRKALLIADMDSTIVTGETLDELADFAGLKDRIAAITARAMNGETRLQGSAARTRGHAAGAAGRCAGAHLAACPPHARRARTGRHDARPWSLRGAGVGGFSFFTSRVAAQCGFDLHRSNMLLDDGTVLTGRVGEPILDRDTKLATLTGLAAERGLALSATLAVGDGANDLDMLRAAGLGVAFRAKPIVAAAAQARVDHADLRALLFAQGYRAEEIVAQWP